MYENSNKIMHLSVLATTSQKLNLHIFICSNNLQSLSSIKKIDKKIIIHYFFKMNYKIKYNKKIQYNQNDTTG
jgi:hypothetical protein